MKIRSRVLSNRFRISRLNHVSKNSGFEAFCSLKTVENAQSSLGLFLNKVREGVVARGRWCAQINRIVLKRKHLLLFFVTCCVLGLCQDPAPRPKMV